MSNITRQKKKKNSILVKRMMIILDNMLEQVGRENLNLDFLYKRPILLNYKSFDDMIIMVVMN